MRYTDVFCRCYSLETGTKVIAWFYIVIYLFNCFVNIFVSDIVKSYENSIDEDIIDDEDYLLGFHYVCLVYGIVTIGLAAAVLMKFVNQSELFLRFIIKWNIFRCFFTFVAILFVAISFGHIFTVFISSFALILDFCASTYFTGIIASYLNVLENPIGQESDTQKHSHIQLISHKKTQGQSTQTSSIDVVVDKPSDIPSSVNHPEINGVLCIANTGEDHADGQEKTQEDNSAPCQEKSQEPTKQSCVETVEVVIETKQHDVSEVNDNVVDMKQEEVESPESISGKPNEDNAETNDADQDKNEGIAKPNDPCRNTSSSTTGNDEVVSNRPDVGVSNLALEIEDKDQSGAGVIVVNLKVGGENGKGSEANGKGSEEEEKGLKKKKRESGEEKNGSSVEEKGSDDEKGIKNAGLDDSEMQPPVMTIATGSAQEDQERL